ncbi:hypothetical protein [Paraclostridium sordellii]|nr:hypothetical protein [Paeniclostridium sordellii]EPZ61071.1 hypothetical protein H476_0267 [[Clostridium] sordellii VPI 9048] [Paeniclostridium sordellii VPI 9048]
MAFLLDTFKCVFKELVGVFSELRNYFTNSKIKVIVREIYRKDKD